MNEANKPRRGRRPGRNAPHPVDVHVGARLRMRRTLLGMSQTALANALGLTFQQVQKYESGANRISASRLYEISQLLDVPVTYFFEEIPTNGIDALSVHKTTSTDDPNPFAKRETLELMRAYFRIPAAHQRQRVSALIKALANDRD